MLKPLKNKKSKTDWSSSITLVGMEDKFERELKISMKKFVFK
jgi:hypothetical protein